MRSLIVLILCAVLAACQSVPVVREPVVVTRYVYVRVSPALTAPCPVAEPRNDGGPELLRVARARKAALIGCANAKLRQIAEIEGTPAPEPVP